ncbi:type I methionyl aminopeptidase [Victivallaceae bacterium BBE-744-WT-12]|uniref:Methionine aminopeptidase n=1 Tax=Victivallis lenta TaxID=2606640 RepID=A0A844G1M4_9BACT|nr:type I methionyl aminopeptidase [Victivallis lenta]MST96399.1 type I methionyl aminopeptidase [Victivallis lenta]
MSRDQVIHTPEEIARIRLAAAVTAQVRDEIAAQARPGMTTFDLDQLAGELIRATGGKSAFLGYRGYPGNICISVNDEVVHGIGTPDRILLDTDIVSIDVGIELDGGIGDTALTFGFGELTPDLKRLLHGTKEALMAGIKQAKRGNCIRDISQAVESTAKRHRLGVVREYVGHGCGVKLHEPPEVPNFVGFGRGALLVPGMVICIEPMLNLGTHKVTTDSHDHWTVRTRDGACAAHFEHMVLITENESEILTWPKTT